MNSVQNIKIDLAKLGLSQKVHVMQGDQFSRIIRISLYSASAYWTVPAGTVAVIHYRKENGTSGEYDTLADGSQAYSVNGNTVTITLAAQMLAKPGMVELAVSLLLRQNVLTTFPVLVHVHALPSGSDPDTDENYFHISGFLPQPEQAALVGQMLQISDIDEYGKVTGLKPVRKYPELTAEQKDAIHALMLSYYNKRNTVFKYEYNHHRDVYSDGSRCYDADAGKFIINCATFAQLIWMGRSLSDFQGKNGATYSADISKAFDFGYYFDFLRRQRAYGLAKRSNGEITGYYGFKKPNADSYEGSYSYNSYYGANSTRLYNQIFNGFANANDMALELYEMGCEVPMSELQTGDLIFVTKVQGSSPESTFAEHSWRNITHAVVVYDRKENGDLRFMDSNSAAYPILLSSRTHDSEKFLRLVADHYYADCVFCARMPIAFGYASNVPDVITPTPLPDLE